MGRHAKNCECELCKTGAYHDQGLRLIVRARGLCQAKNYPRTTMILDTAIHVYSQEQAKETVVHEA